MAQSVRHERHAQAGNTRQSMSARWKGWALLRCRTELSYSSVRTLHHGKSSRDNAYGDKEAIFLRAFDQYAGQFLETAGDALSQGNAAARLQNFLDVIIANMTSGSRRIRRKQLKEAAATFVDALVASPPGPQR